MHNWSGSYTPTQPRSGLVSSCNRPFANDIVIRANGTVHPCCQVLGRDAEASLGDVNNKRVRDIWFGRKYEALREGHKWGQFPSYCQDCDFLLDDPETLVYSNHAQDGRMHGTHFNLKELTNA